MEKCSKCGQKKGVHKMSCETRKIVVTPKFLDPNDIKHWGFGEEYIFKMLNDIVNGKIK